MGTSTKINEVIELGNTLVGLLRRGRQPDLLTDWMALHIAECIVAARRAKGRAKTAAEERCFSTILQLWRHRQAIPEGHRPFEEFEAILKTIARLDPDHDRWFYFDLKPKWQSAGKSAAKQKRSRVEQNVDLAEGVDRVARILIEYFINDATKAAGKPITRKLLKAGGVNEDAPDLEALNALLKSESISSAKKVADQKNLDNRLVARIEYLKNFNTAASLALQEYESRLRELRRKHTPPKRSSVKARKK